ncbi:MAG: phosphatidylglycerophosphatase A [Methanobrevibacter sp.]|jgi:alpha-ribazole phosphatase CobZ|nr:phosphatidylglycerophosphatase A [Methanobrevibacter sp.]
MKKNTLNTIKLIEENENLKLISSTDLKVFDDYDDNQLSLETKNTDFLNIIKEINILQTNTSEQTPNNPSPSNSLNYKYEYDGYFIEKIEENKNIFILNLYNSSLKKIKVFQNQYHNLEKVLDKTQENKKLNLSQIILIDSELKPKEVIKLYKLAIKTKNNYFNKIQIPKKFKNNLNNNEFTSIILNHGNNNKSKDNDKNNNKNNNKNKDKNEKINKNINFDEIEKNMKALIEKSCEKFFEEINIDFGILDYINSKEITIKQLVDSGMELLVGVEDSEEIREKLYSQILLSLTDINVIALITAAIECEEVFMNKRLREVNVDDDPAYLYTDEVLGLAIANQIAGTKATFNFKRYDEKKPGILSKLDPMSDDIFAGLIAGSMSKIFDEH